MSWIFFKVEVVSNPAEEIEEEDTEGVDLYKGSFSLANGTLTLIRRCTSSATGSTI